MTPVGLGPRTVVVIEDDRDVRRAIEIVVRRSGLTPVCFDRARPALEELRRSNPGMLVLDVGLPDLSGWDVLDRVRAVSDVPVLMLTAQAHESDRVRGLHAGADDYVAKPFGTEELAARIHALLRRATASEAKPRTLTDGPLHVDLLAREVTVGEDAVELTPIEFRLLVALLSHRGRPVSHDELLEEAWNDPTGVGVDRVKYAVLRLRRKLAASGVDAPITSVRGVGYRYEES